MNVAYINRGAAYEGIGRKDLALADYDAVIKLAPDWEVGHRKRAELLTELGRSGEAIVSYTKRIEAAPGDAFAWSDRGDAYEAAGDHQRALADYSAAIERKPDDPRFWHARAMTYRAVGDNAHALGDFDKKLWSFRPITPAPTGSGRKFAAQWATSPRRRRTRPGPTKSQRTGPTRANSCCSSRSPADESRLPPSSRLRRRS